MLRGGHGLFRKPYSILYNYITNKQALGHGNDQLYPILSCLIFTILNLPPIKQREDINHLTFQEELPRLLIGLREYPIYIRHYLVKGSDGEFKNPARF